MNTLLDRARHLLPSIRYHWYASALEEHGLVERRSIEGGRQGIEYRLTPLGESLRPVVRSLMQWGTRHAEALDEAGKLLPCEAVVRSRVA